MPRARSSSTMASVKGVLPVPPTVMLPTTITGTPMVTGDARRARDADTLRYKASSGKVHQGGGRSEYQRCCRRVASDMALGRPAGGQRRCVAELHAMQRGVGTTLRQKLAVRTQFRHLALLHHGNLVGVFDGGQAM